MNGVACSSQQLTAGNTATTNCREYNNVALKSCISATDLVCLSTLYADLMPEVIGFPDLLTQMLFFFNWMGIAVLTKGFEG